MGGSADPCPRRIFTDWIICASWRTEAVPTSRALLPSYPQAFVLGQMQPSCCTMSHAKAFA